jgi:hypothetical protein
MHSCDQLLKRYLEKTHNESKGVDSYTCVGLRAGQHMTMYPTAVMKEVFTTWKNRSELGVSLCERMTKAMRAFELLAEMENIEAATPTELARMKPFAGRAECSTAYCPDLGLGDDADYNKTLAVPQGHKALFQRRTTATIVAGPARVRASKPLVRQLAKQKVTKSRQSIKESTVNASFQSECSASMHTRSARLGGRDLAQKFVQGLAANINARSCLGTLQLPLVPMSTVHPRSQPNPFEFSQSENSTASANATVRVHAPASAATTQYPIKPTPQRAHGRWTLTPASAIVPSPFSLMHYGSCVPQSDAQSVPQSAVPALPLALASSPTPVVSPNFGSGLLNTLDASASNIATGLALPTGCDSDMDRIDTLFQLSVDGFLCSSAFTNTLLQAKAAPKSFVFSPIVPILARENAIAATLESSWAIPKNHQASAVGFLTTVNDALTMKNRALAGIDILRVHA